MPELFAGIGAVVTGYVVPALVVLTVVVYVHEMGHFLVARWCGIRVAAFSIGFGRELVGYTDRRGTRWKLSLVPLGGYVRFEGDENAASLPDADAMAATPLAAREGLFHFASVWKRAAVVAAGPLANFLLAIVVFAGLFTTIGRPTSVPRADEVVAGSPADRAGIQPGDRIVSIDGRQIESFSELQSIVMLATGEPLAIVVQRGSQTLEMVATPERQERPDGMGGTQRIGVLGISRTLGAGDVVFERTTLLTAIPAGVAETWNISERTLTYIGRLFTGRETADQLTGPIRVAQISGIVASTGGLPGFIHLLAVLSVSIGLFNLFPVPMLDGGHLAFYLVEALRGRPLSPRFQELGFRIGFALVIFLFIFVTFNDITNLGGT